MNSVNNEKNIRESVTACVHRYNWQHLIFVSKYRYRMFKNPKTCHIIHDAICDVAQRHGIGVKEFAVGEDFEHIHLEVDVPNTMSVSTAVQLLKGYSSYVVFKEIPGHRLRYPKGHLFSLGKFCRTVGPVDLEKEIDYVQNQAMKHSLDPQQKKMSWFT